MEDRYLFLKGCKVVTVNSGDDIIDGGVVVTKNDRIDFVGTEEEASRKYEDIPYELMEYENGMILPIHICFKA